MRLLFALVLALTAPLLPEEEAPTPQPIPDNTSYHLEELADNLQSPTYLTHAGDGSARLFVLEQDGIIWIYDEAYDRLPSPFLDITSLVNREHLERGLLGLAFHPDFTENGYFYVHYTAEPRGDTVIARYTVNGDDANSAEPDSAMSIFTLPQPDGSHNGGMIEFGPDGYLYIGLGDSGDPGDPLGSAQNPGDLLGSILRIDVDGGYPYTIPEDNPAFTVNDELAPEIWAWGLRNPWRFAFDGETGDLYIADVGQWEIEVVNFQLADHPGGKNYGWPIFEGTQEFTGEDDPGDTIDPVVEYDRDWGCAIIGGFIYRGEELPELEGHYFFGDWCTGTIWTTFQNDNGDWHTEKLLQPDEVNINSFGKDETGELYVLDLGGRMFRLTNDDG